MPRPKSQLRQHLSYRRLRWTLSHLLLGRIPPLARHLNFHPRGVHPADVAELVVEDARIDVRAGFSARQLKLMREYCRFADAGSAETDASGIASFELKTHVLRDVEILGHTGAVAVPRARAMIWAAPGLPSWNLAKARRLGTIAGPDQRTVGLSGTDNYFHFLMNDVVPLFDYLERLHPAAMPLSLVLPRTPPTFTLQTLQALQQAFDGLSLHRIGDDEKMAVEELLTLERRAANREWYLWDGALAGRLKAILMRHFRQKPEPGHGRPLFVRRGRARLRRLVNEDALARIAESRGAQVFTPAADNFAEQVCLFDGAPLAISAHGAALANLMWCRPGAQVLELFPANFVKSTYMWLADRIGMQHHALRGGIGDPYLAFSVDPERFAQRLDTLLEACETGAA